MVNNINKIKNVYLHIIYIIRKNKLNNISKKIGIKK